MMQSCLDLKNYEAVFAIVAGLESKSIQQVADSWQVRIIILLLLGCEMFGGGKVRKSEINPFSW